MPLSLGSGSLHVLSGSEICLEWLKNMAEAAHFHGCIQILREFVKPYRAAPKKQATVRYETAPGRQAQVDWAEEIGEFYVDGRKRPLYAFLIILSYSRKRYIEFTTDMTQETLMKCHMNAFAYFQGIPQQLLYDNMRTVVTKHSVKQIRFNKRFEDFLAYYGVVPKACKPYRAQTKGKIEKAVDYLKSNFLQRRLPDTLEELNHEVLKWLDNVVHQKPNQTTQQSPDERFSEERTLLLPWNTKPLYQVKQWELREVSKDCLISYRQNRYSVPYRYAGQRVNPLEEGRFFTKEDEANTNRVVVLGKRIHASLLNQKQELPKTDSAQYAESEKAWWQRLLDRLTGTSVSAAKATTEAESLVGKEVTIQGETFTVVGVLKSEATLELTSDNSVFMPVQTAIEVISTENLTSIYVKVDSIDNLDQAEKDVHGAVSINHPETDFSTIKQTEMLDAIDTVTRILQVMLIGITVTALIISGVGIMNVMVMSVRERTREIGIRKALGASTMEILFQFFFETILLCLAGGIIGLMLGYGFVTWWNGAITTFPLVFPMWVIQLALGSSILIGMVCGVYPAIKAARLKVCRALRFE